MRISYDGIEFEVLKIEEWTTEAVYDSLAGADFLFYHHRIQAICMLNEGYTDKLNFPPTEEPETGIEQESVTATTATRWNGLKIPGGILQASQPVVPTAQAPLVNRSTGVAPTFVEILNRLALPRKRLIVWIDSNPNLALQDPQFRDVILYAPYPGKETDALHGPTCSVIGFPSGSVGNTTIPMRIMFEAHISPCNDIKSPVLISNRWEFTTSYDPDSYAAIHIINGEARFRVDLLHQLHMSADQFRNQFIHPIPLGFKREQPQITLSPGGDTVRYQLVDRQLLSNAPGGIPYAAPKISVSEERTYVSPVGISDIEGALGRVANFFS